MIEFIDMLKISSQIRRELNRINNLTHYICYKEDGIITIFFNYNDYIGYFIVDNVGVITFLDDNQELSYVQENEIADFIHNFFHNIN
jgi:hypothetical protein